MKRIFFNNSSSVFNVTAVAVAIAAMISVNIFQFDISPQQIYLIKVVAYLLVIFVFGRIVIQNIFLKNLVNYNARAMQIKIDSHRSIGIAYNTIKKHTFRNGVLSINTTDKDYDFDLVKYRGKDVKKFLGIIDKYVKK